MNDNSQITPPSRPNGWPEQNENATEPTTLSDLIAWFANCDCLRQKRGTFCDHFLRYLDELESRGEINDVDAHLRSRTSARVRRRRKRNYPESPTRRVWS
jgi:hypothetical protein